MKRYDRVATLTFGSLFAGIGGLDLGLERSGMVCKWQVEIDTRCNEVLAYHWPNMKRYGDVNDVGKRNLTPVDLICGGFPCQDVSIAGRRAGLAGKRSGLWFQFYRVVEELEPEWVVIENVPGLLSSNKGRDLATILSGLAELGYWWAYRVLDAQYYGLAQRRRRVFIVGCLTRGRAQEVLFERESSPWDSAPSRETGTRLAATLSRGSAMGSGVNEPGRRREDDVNLVAATLNSGGSAGGFRTEPGEHLVATFQETGMGWYKESGTGGTLRERDSRDGASNAVVEAYGFSQESDGSIVRNASNLARPITGRHGDPGVVAFAERTREGGRNLETQDDLAYALTDLASEGTAHSRRIAGGFGVRRLTPTECERLQGFPDDHTAVNGMSDSARYRMLGNAVAVPVAEWIGQQIVLAESKAVT